MLQRGYPSMRRKPFNDAVENSAISLHIEPTNSGRTLQKLQQALSRIMRFPKSVADVYDLEVLRKRFGEKMFDSVGSIAQTMSTGAICIIAKFSLHVRFV